MALDQPPEPRPAQANQEQSSTDEPMLYCPRCSAKLEPMKCKLLCGRCGYYMSCADYY